jgi:hypothetical protein
MGFYRPSRNIEASLIDYITERFEEENWSDISVEKSFKRAYTIAMNMNDGEAVVCVRTSSTNRKTFEIGTNSLLRSQLVLIDIFATNDGQRLDLVDFIIDELKAGCPYCEYQTEGNTKTSKIQNGRIRITNMDDSPVNFNTNKSDLDLQDRYRHLITLTISLGKAEA